MTSVDFHYIAVPNPKPQRIHPFGAYPRTYASTLQPWLVRYNQPTHFMQHRQQNPKQQVNETHYPPKYPR